MCSAAVTRTVSSPAAERPKRSERPERPRRAAIAPLPLFEVLDQAHVAALAMLKSFESLLQRLETHGADDAARARADEILDYFSGPGRDHHLQEEQQVFPGLLASADAALVQHVRRLQQDHGWIEEDWRELAPQVEAIARGFDWYDAAMLRAALPVFTALYQEHIALEETLVYPAARQQLLERLSGEQARIAAG